MKSRETLTRVSIIVLGLIFSFVLSPALAVEVYDTISPINLTIGYWKAKPSTSDKYKIEQMVRHTAVAILEATNGAHILGNVRIIEDPRWKMHVNFLQEHKRLLTGDPLADCTTSGYLPHGQYSVVSHPVTMGENYLGYSKRTAGYTLAHELGHYIYGVYDEYPGKWPVALPFMPFIGDSLVNIPTLMEDTGTLEETNDVRGLRFSTKYNYGVYGVGANKVDPLAVLLFSTAQKRMYGLSAWETIASSASSNIMRGRHKERSQYKDLESISPDLYQPAPAVSFDKFDGKKQKLPTEDATDFSPADQSLDIRWGASKTARILLVDQSGSIDQLGNTVNVIAAVVKQIASAPRGTHLAIYSFSNERQEIVPMTEIPLDGLGEMAAKLAMQQRFLQWSLSNYPPYGSTNLYQSIQDSLRSLDVRSDKYLQDNDIVLSDLCVITDGGDTHSTNPDKSLEDIIQYSRSAFVPVHIVGLQVSNGLGKNFWQLAKNVGGRYSTQWLYKTTLLNGVDVEQAIADSGIKVHEGFYALAPLSTIVLGGRGQALIPQPFFQYDIPGMSLYANTPVVEMMRRANLSTNAPTGGSSLWGSQFLTGSVYRGGVTERGFYIDSSLANFAVHIDHTGAAEDIEITLTDPGGRSHPLQLMYTNDVFTSIGSSYMATFDANEALIGNWALKCENKSDKEKNFIVRVNGQSHFAASDVKPVMHSSFVASKHNMINYAETGGRYKVFFSTSRGNALLTSLDIEAYVEDVYGNRVNAFSQPRDDGSGGDEVAGDGIYTSILQPYVTFVGGAAYKVTSRVSNGSGNAVETFMLSQIDPSDSGETDGASVFGEKVSENFNRAATTFLFSIEDDAMILPSTPPPAAMAVFHTNGVHGLNTLLLGTDDKEFSIDITPEPLFDYLSKDIVWELANSIPGVELLPDLQGRKHVARVRFSEPTWDTVTLKARISYDLNPGMDADTRTLTLREMERSINLRVEEPMFYESKFDTYKNGKMTVFAGDKVELDSRLMVPTGYSDETKWTISRATGVNVPPANVARIVREDADSCMVEMLNPGEITLTLASVPYSFINDSFSLKIIHREQGGSVTPDPNDDDGTHPNPIPDNPDPGGDDSVDTDAGDGGTKPGDDTGGGGESGSDSGGGKKPVYEEWEDAEPNAPKLLRITADGRLPASADVAAMRAVTLRFEFDAPIDRYTLSAILSGDISIRQGEDYAVVSGFVLSEDGKTLTVSFLPKYEGLFVLYYSFEGKNGLSLRGGFGLYAEKASASTPYTPPQDGGSGKGGGCGVAALPFALLLLCALSMWKGILRRKHTLWAVLLCAFFAMTTPAGAATYVVTDPGDEVDFPPAGSLRSIQHTIDLLGVHGNVVQFAPNIETIELKGTLFVRYSTKLDGYTGRAGKRIVLTLAAGGYRHVMNGDYISDGGYESAFQHDFLANGIVFQGFGKGDPRNVAGADNGGLFCGGSHAAGVRLENCSFVNIVGDSAPVVINFYTRWQNTFEAVFEKCLFRGNVAENGAGAMQIINGSIALQDSFVGYNRAKEKGGVAVNWYPDETVESGGGSPSANNASMHNTVVNNYTGAVRPRGKRNPGNVKMHDERRQDKQTIEFRKGNPALPSGLVTLSRCSVTDNESRLSGGAFVCTGLLLCNSTLAGNSAGIGDPVITGVQPDFHASLFAGNDLGAVNPTPDRYEYDDKGNLYANGVTETVLRKIFEKYPLVEEDRGGYTPVVPIKYAGPAEGMISADLRDSINPHHPLVFDVDVRGVPRRYAEGASIGAYEFGRVTIEPGNVQNSTTIGLKPNDKGSIKVKLIERISVGGLSATNYLAEIPLTFALKDGDNLEALPHDTETADNGRAFAMVSTLGAGTSVVRAALSDRPARFLDLDVKVDGEQSAGGNPSSGQDDDDLYVVTLDPGLTAPGVENAYWATFSRTCASSAVSIRRKGTTDYIKRDIPVDMLPSMYGKLREAISFEKNGSYMFDFAMTDGKGRPYTDTKEVRVEASSLKVFRMSEPPYYEDKTLSMLASFSTAPKEISMALTDENGTVYKTDLYSKNDRLEWEGFVTSGRTGYYAATLEYVDGGDGKSHKERFTIYVAPYYGTGSTVVSGGGGGGGCDAGALGLLSIVLSWVLVLSRKKLE